MIYFDYKIYLLLLILYGFIHCNGQYYHSKQCNYTMTMVNNAPVRCSGQLIFEDDFNGESLDLKKWYIERRIPQDPDYEFNMYLNKIDTVLRIRRGNLIMKPEATDQIYETDTPSRTISLGSSCTGRLGTDECIFQRRGLNALNPLVTAQIKTKDKFSFKYGRVEIRAKLPGSMWVYPQLWLEPTTFSYGAINYYSGQMRVAHTIANGDDIILKGGLILNAMEPWRSLKMCQHQNKTLSLSYEFHKYELVWDPTFISVAVDGDVYCRIEIQNEKEEFKNLVISDESLPNNELLKEGGIWAPFDQEFYLTLGYGVGGHREFKDHQQWEVEKPWFNFNPRSKLSFWNKVSKNINWLNYGDMKIDYVRVHAI